MDQQTCCLFQSTFSSNCPWINLPFFGDWSPHALTFRSLFFIRVQHMLPEKMAQQVDDGNLINHPFFHQHICGSQCNAASILVSLIFQTQRGLDSLFSTQAIQEAAVIDSPSNIAGVHSLVLGKIIQLVPAHHSSLTSWAFGPHS